MVSDIGENSTQFDGYGGRPREQYGAREQQGVQVQWFVGMYTLHCDFQVPPQFLCLDNLVAIPYLASMTAFGLLSLVAPY